MNFRHFMRRGVPNAPQPGTPAWKRFLTASKIPAVMHTSPWQTRFQLWHEMAGNIEVEPPNPTVLDRGHRLEEPIARWLDDQHHELSIKPCMGRWWQAGTRYAATPDRLAIDERGHVAALVEIKTASNPAGWGRPGTDEIPAYYYDQVQWQMHCTGADRVMVAVLLGVRLEFAEYLVERDDVRICQMVRAAEEFMDSLEAGVEPDWSVEAGDFQVYETIRELHPDIEDYAVEATEEAAQAITRYRKAKRLAEVTEARAKAYAAAELETGRALTYRGDTIAHRTARKTRTGEQGAPYIAFTKGK